MKKCYLGIDVGSYAFKGVIIDSKKNIICSSYIYDISKVVNGVRRLIEDLYEQIDLDKYKIMGVGVTGTYRKIVGILLNANVIRNEIVCHSVSGNYFYKKINNIIDISKNNIKIINICNKKVIDYSIDKFNINDSYELDKYFRNKDLKRISVQGGNSKNKDIINIIRKYVSDIYINDNSCLMGSIGAALIVLNSGIEREYNIKIEDIRYDIREINCERCNNKCNIICVCRDNEILDYRGSKCDRYVDKISI